MKFRKLLVEKIHYENEYQKTLAHYSKLKNDFSKNHTEFTQTSQ